MVIFLELTSQGILYNLCSSDLSKSFSHFIVPIFIFSIYFYQQILSSGKNLYEFFVSIFILSQYFFQQILLVEKCGVSPHCLYRDSLTINFDNYLSQGWIQKHLGLKPYIDNNHAFLSKIRTDVRQPQVNLLYSVTIHLKFSRPLLSRVFNVFIDIVQFYLLHS